MVGPVGGGFNAGPPTVGPAEVEAMGLKVNAGSFGLLTRLLGATGSPADLLRAGLDGEAACRRADKELVKCPCSSVANTPGTRPCTRAGEG